MNIRTLLAATVVAASLTAGSQPAEASEGNRLSVKTVTQMTKKAGKMLADYKSSENGSELITLERSKPRCKRIKSTVIDCQMFATIELYDAVLECNLRLRFRMGPAHYKGQPATHRISMYDNRRAGYPGDPGSTPCSVDLLS
jgi:hypothetical protein